LLPVVVWLVSPDGGLPPAWLVAAGSLLGVGAHGANVLPDYERDRSTEVMGLPQRLGLHMLRLATAGALLAALALLTFGPPGSPQAWDWAAFGVGCVLTLVAAAGSFPAVIAIAALAVAVLVVRGMVG
jgi:4-hydroxybenzoate polyprenyltransferase